MIRPSHVVFYSLLILFTLFSFTRTGLSAAETGELKVGWSMTDITPPEKVALVGQLHKRLSEGVLDPLRATVLALETVNDKGVSEQVVFVSCDLIGIRKQTQDEVQAAINERLKDLDGKNVFLNATHTHTAPQQVDSAFRDLYDVSQDEGVWKASQYREFLVEKIVTAVEEAWNKRAPGGFSWGLGHASVGHNRRATYFDGHAKMYGLTNIPEFYRIEGYTDHAVQMLFFWNEQQEVTGIIVNIACPSQETEGLRVLSADFWHDVREEVWKRHSKEVFILPQCAAAGDISPHHIYRKQPEEIMLKRKGISSRQQIATRIVDAIDETMPYVKDSIQTDVALVHKVTNFTLPKAEVEPPFYLTDDPNEVDIHLIRIGDVALVNNPFELYLDYGVRIQARSPAVMTMTIQLSSGLCGYLPTRPAVSGGGYSAEKFVIGPDGGDALVEQSVEGIQGLFP
ncbi:neutral/alkaline non-lysosomal ceramidase N-terminal domain-containing protein [Polystyrenella longa]|uniref:neutral/alkaline non-lysosomal ceramidase N-terminal domain-containing protein n=1 Tax=Polystyrenella longa TaxID=2528007 RepID=UPI0018D2199F|nr:neutral/alkaline non-lysosomal ceramidase N-terminal domain-containing protein [Polystyrenella longa]